MKNNQKNRPNVIFLIVDCLRQDKLGAVGYKPDLTPNLNKLYLNGLKATKHYSNGCVTQVAFPSIFTSSLPLDYGGYNDGIKNRPISFPETLFNEGYETLGAVTGHPCCSHFGYDRGFQTFQNLIDLYQWFTQLFKVELREALDDIKLKKISISSFITKIKDKYKNYLKMTIKYLDEMDSLNLPNQGWNRRKLKKKIHKEIYLIENKTTIVAKKIIEQDKNIRFFMGQENINKFSKLKVFIYNKARDLLNKKIFILSRRKCFSAKLVNKNFKEFFLKKNNKKPFFAYLHYFEIHEAKLLLANFSIKQAFSIIKSIYKASKRVFNKGGFLYDVALSRIDTEIGDLIKFLEKEKVINNTIIVITGDHGANAGIPNRKITNSSSNMYEMFGDEYHHVPLIFYGPGVKKFKITKPCSHIDLAPTLLNILKIKIPSSFLGKPITEKLIKKNDVVIAENTGNGLCDIKEKTIAISLRTEKIKIVYNIINFNVKEKEVYDLNHDQWGFSNIVKTNKFMKDRSLLMTIAKQRSLKLKKENS